ncbi:hypothetical protein OCU04_008661 [Sclerotinia nivalis]|nr:hypothetical protein OCU04_008661 [Sclerotinia nivalis]
MIVFLPSEKTLIHFKLDKQLSDRFMIPNSFWDSVSQEASGFFRCQESRNVDDTLEVHTTIFRVLIKQPNVGPSSCKNNGILYTWHNFTFLTSWLPSNKLIVLCFDLPSPFQNTLTASLINPSTRLEMRDPYSIHVLLLWEITKLFDFALWALRDLVRDLEKNRTSKEDPQPDYNRMHELARHAIHTSEMLETTLETLMAIIREHELFFNNNTTLPKSIRTISKQTMRDLQFQNTILKSLHLRSKALEDRLRNEINLAFNIVAQYDSRISVRLSKAMQMDSFSMRTIAVLGLLFLPGTFICAIFSTSFFNFSPGNSIEPQRWMVSDKFWIYWVVTIPLTLVIMLLWFIYQPLYRNQKWDRR